MTKEPADMGLLTYITKEHKAVSLSVTDSYGNVEAEVYLAHVMYVPEKESYVAYWDPSDCSRKSVRGYEPPQLPKGMHSWKLCGCSGTALYRNLKVLDTYVLGGL